MKLLGIVLTIFKCSYNSLQDFIVFLHHGQQFHQEDHHDESSKFHHDNNYRAAICHVVADAFVSILVIISLVIIGLTGRAQFLDPLVALVGAFVILSWSWTLIIDTSLNLLDTLPDKKMVEKLRAKLMSDGTRVDDLHVWRLGPGHLGAILSLTTDEKYRGDFERKGRRDRDYYMNRIRGFKALSHVTIEINYRKRMNDGQLEADSMV